MRKSYLESYYSIIPQTQQKKLLEVLKVSEDLAGVTSDPATLQSKLQQLIVELEKPLGTPLINLRKAVKFGKVISGDYNKTMQECYADLGALFDQDNNINKTILIHRTINNSVSSDVKAALEKVTNDISVYKVLSHDSTGITDAIFNSFYKDDNTYSDPVFKVWNDTDTNALKLPIGVDHSSLSISGLALAAITAKRYGGGMLGVTNTGEGSLTNAIDESSDTFWADVILADQPIVQTYDGSGVFGTVCELVIDLSRSELINYIRFNPFTHYPLTILKVKYRGNSSESWVDLGVSSQTGSGILEFSFNEVLAREIMIVVNQQNCSVNTYKMPKTLINNSLLWQQIVDRELSITEQSRATTSATQDMLDYSDGWQAFLDASEQYKQKLLATGDTSNINNVNSFSESMFDASTQQILSTSQVGADPLKLDLYGTKSKPNDEIVEVRKYEYIYGAYNIDIKKLWFLDKGVYTSPKYKSKGPIVEAELDVDEVVPSGTSIEYSVATRDGEWRDIIPNGGSSYITKEKVDISSMTQSGTLRFACSGVLDLKGVYLNDVPITSDGYTFNILNSDIAIASGWYVGSASYTASYSPSGVQKTVSFISDPLISANETHSTTDSRQYRVELDHYPFLDYRVINDTAEAHKSDPDFEYSTGRWKNMRSYEVYGIQASPLGYYDPLLVTVDGYSAENMTDYYENIRPALTQYDIIKYPNFEYFHSGKNIYFNADLRNRSVKVAYSYLNDFIQLRAILRNNLRSTITMTPSLGSYTMKLRTL